MKLAANKEIEEIIKKIAGEDVFSLIKKLKSKKKVSDIKLAEDCNKKLNDVRSILYKLHNFNLVSFVKKRDKETGWYIYYWSIDIKKMHDFFVNFKNEELRGLRRSLKDEEHKKFYVCANKCIRLDFENASGCKFRCPECGCLLDYDENNKKIELIREKINNIKKIIN